VINQWGGQGGERGEAKGGQPSRLLRRLQHLLQHRNLKALIVFDDVQNFEDIKVYLPLFQGQDILITTRNSTLSFHSLHIGPFLRGESLHYVDSFFKEEPGEAKEALVQKFKDCPISLALALDYMISSPGVDIASYLEIHRTRDLALPPASQAYDSPIDGYQEDLCSAIALNLQELKRKTPEAYDLINFLSFLHPEDIDLSYIEAWYQRQNIKKDFNVVMNHIRHYSFFECSPAANTRGVQIRIPDLVHKTINALIPVQEKKELLLEISSVFLKYLDKRTDLVLEEVMDNIPLVFHCLTLSKRAHELNLHFPEMTSLRLKLFDLLASKLHDYPNAALIQKRIEEDMAQGTKVTPKDKIGYLISASVYSLFHDSDCEKAIQLGEKALSLLFQEEEESEEKIRVIGNLIQYHVALGNLRACESLIEEGERLLPLSLSPTYNVLFLLAKGLYMVDRGEIKVASDLIHQHQEAVEKLSHLSPFRLHMVKLSAEALIRQGKEREASPLLKQLEALGHSFYKERENTFYAHLDTLKAQCLLKEGRLPEARDLLHQALRVYAESLKGESKHRRQAFTHFVLGNLYQEMKEPEKALTHYLKSESIYDRLLKGKAIEDVSLLYQRLVISGVLLKDEVLTHTYLKKHLKTFGLKHPGTGAVLHHLDAKGLATPL
jgi:tetratricopeptide (TPR) repeat protein